MKRRPLAAPTALVRCQTRRYAVCMYSNTSGYYSDRPPFHSTQLPDRLRVRRRSLRYSIRTGRIHVHRAEHFRRWHGMRHPFGPAARAAEAFLAHLGAERHVPVSTGHPALGAILFLYRDVLRVELR